MERGALIQRSIDYIEENLKAEISTQELADAAGFSLYHYCRLFRSATGMTVGHYILRRRLLHGVYAIARGCSGIQASLDYGFDTYAGFYRAFVREFGCTSSEYLRSGRAKKPWRIDLAKEEHMIVTHKTAARLLKHWGLEGERLTDVCVGGTGARKENVIAVGERHFLKYSHDLGRLKNHAALSKSLASAGLWAAVPIPDAGGRECIPEGDAWFCLTECLPGEPMKAAELLDPAAARKAGAAIGTLQQVLAKTDATVEEADLPRTLRDWALHAAREALDLDPRWCREFLAEFERLWPELPSQIIHRDPNPGNLVRAGEEWGFLDFELSERNARIYDPCYTATAVLSETFPKTDGWLDTFHAILAGYDEAVKLTQSERAAARYALLANQFVCVAWFAGQEQYAELFETNKRMTRWLLERFDEL